MVLDIWPCIKYTMHQSDIRPAYMRLKSPIYRFSSKACTGWQKSNLFDGNFADGLPSQMASNAISVSTPWRLHEEGTLWTTLKKTHITLIVAKLKNQHERKNKRITKYGWYALNFVGCRTLQLKQRRKVNRDTEDWQALTRRSTVANPRSKFGIQYMRQFVPYWCLRCGQCRETCSHVSSIQNTISSPLCWKALTHWGRDKMAGIFQTTFLNAFSCLKMYEFGLRFHWNLFLWFELTIFQHWFW